MDITTRALWAVIHGMAFGGLYLLACSGALILLYRASADLTETQRRFAAFYLVAMAALAWAAVVSGSYILYPWYRAVPPPGTVDLSNFPQRLLLSKPSTRDWHFIGMEWKEHVSWLVPISITMVAAVFIRYGRELRNHLELRSALLVFASASLLAAGIAGFFGAEINKHAPVEGGGTIQFSRGESK